MIGSMWVWYVRTGQVHNGLTRGTARARHGCRPLIDKAEASQNKNYLPASSCLEQSAKAANLKTQQIEQTNGNQSCQNQQGSKPAKALLFHISFNYIIQILCGSPFLESAEGALYPFPRCSLLGPVSLHGNSFNI